MPIYEPAGQHFIKWRRSKIVVSCFVSWTFPPETMIAVVVRRDVETSRDNCFAPKALACGPFEIKQINKLKG